MVIDSLSTIIYFENQYIVNFINMLLITCKVNNFLYIHTSNVVENLVKSVLKIKCKLFCHSFKFLHKMLVIKNKIIIEIFNIKFLSAFHKLLTCC